MNLAWNKEVMLILVLALVLVASGVDLAADLAHGADRDHIIKEAAVVVISGLAIAWLLLGLRRQRLEISDLRAELAAARELPAGAGQAVVEARQRLGGVIAGQFREWQLTESEQEVGWLLLKGLSLKEIALLRETREKTVRQQASSIYRKAGLAGRHAFAAWFIEDML